MRTSYLFFLPILVLFAVSCSNIEGLVENENKFLEQFGDRVLDFSSEFTSGPGPWSSFVLLGEPDTYPEYGDIQTAWASKSSNEGYEFVAIAFDTAQFVNQISIYETFNPGAVAEILLRNYENDQWITVYDEGPKLHLPKEARIMEVNIPETDFLVDAIKIEVNSQAVLGWNEIDAVSISGRRVLE